MYNTFEILIIPLLQLLVRTNLPIINDISYPKIANKKLICKRFFPKKHEWANFAHEWQIFLHEWAKFAHEWELAWRYD